MSYNWGPYFIVPSEILKNFRGIVRLRESLDEDLLLKELEALSFPKAIAKITNPWYYRKKNTGSWIKIGESDDKRENFPASWDTTNLENGQYEVLGSMHVFVKHGGVEKVIARQSIVEVTVEN